MTLGKAVLPQDYKGPLIPPSLRTRQKMHGNEHGRCQRNGHAVQDIEAQERIAADEASAQEQEARVGPRMDQRYVATLRNVAPGPS